MGCLELSQKTLDIYREHTSLVQAATLVLAYLLSPARPSSYLFVLFLK